MENGVIRALACLSSGFLTLGLFGCANPAQMTMTDALQKLEDSGSPCAFPLFSGFDTAVDSEQKMFCRASGDVEEGFKVTFFDSAADFEKALKLECDITKASNGPTLVKSLPVLKGENWLAEVTPGGDWELEELKSLIGGSESELNDICEGYN